jgi:hypothetical protein
MRRIEWYSLFSLCALCVSAVGSSPELTGIMPRGGQRGTEVVVEFTGDRLGDVVEIMAHEPGISVSSYESTQKSVKATLKIAADCPLGEHALHIRTETGISPLRTFWVGALPVVNEKEPNNDFARPQKIALNSTVHGSITYEDVDHFAVDMTKGQRLTIEVEAMRLGGAFFDAQVGILDAQKHELAKFDDSPLTGNDPCGSIVVPYDGTYIIRIHEAAWAAGDQYRLHIGMMPRPTVVFPTGGQKGRKLDVTFLGDAHGKVERGVELPRKIPHAPFALSLDDDDGVCPSSIPFRVSDCREVVEREPNDAPLGSQLGFVPCAFNGIIAKPGDRDLFRVRLKKDTTYDIRVYARQCGSPLDSYVWLADADGKILAQNDDNETTHDSRIIYASPEDRQCILGIRDQIDRGGPLFVYRVEVTPINPHLEAALAGTGELLSQDRMTVSVPQGNRMAALVLIRRTYWNGPVKFDFVDLPAGIKADTERSMSLPATPVLFEAADDAPLAGSFADFRGECVGAQAKATTEFLQPVNLNLLINQLIHTYRAARMPIAVVKPVPFRLQLIEAKAPLARGGSTQLKVFVERLHDFDGEIRLQLLHSHPGVSAPNEVILPPGRSEALIPLTANINAALTSSRIAVVGAGDVSGPAKASTQLANLEVVLAHLQIALERANVEPGKQVDIVGKVTVATKFDGAAKVKLMGLPPKLSAPEVEITADTKEIRIPVSADAACPPGPVRNLFCQVTLTHAGEPVTFATGTGEMRVNAAPRVKTAAK